MGASLFEPINVYKPVLMRIDCRYRVRELIKIVTWAALTLLVHVPGCAR